MIKNVIEYITIYSHMSPVKTLTMRIVMCTSSDLIRLRYEI